MIPLRRSIQVKSLNILDLLLPVLSLLIAAFLLDLPNLGSLERLLATEIKLRNAALISGFLIIWHCIFSEQRLDVSRRFFSIRSELKDIVKATSLGTLSLLLLSQLCHIRLITSPFLFGFWGNVTLLTIAVRLTLRYCLRKQPCHFYEWQKMFFEKGTAAFASTQDSQKSAETVRIQQLEAKLQRKHEVLSELMEEHIKLKKELGEL